MYERTGQSDEVVGVESEDITAFAERLSEWSRSLPAAEQSLAEVLLQYTRDLQPGDVRRRQLIASLDEATRSAIESVREQWKKTARGPIAWVRTEPSWEKANPRVGGGVVEEYEIVQWSYVRPERWTPPYA
ncbi:hypothetical protein ONA91_15365 [Micromonospora sp. DR5-3]|uniref:hypothetical protein n=1 Tax=unclassified Micromonospora TaxID=2617518 RepID=UPI0011D75DA1|nr:MULTISPECIES: hypothetical protein [unclassified Micromonospora]MCW3815824.1 hypothetical protein [Micromonospora sp. DR5-3]TYC21192.1 hypothetical protein FXF52_27120 [Micromonospora sp. MP36]